MAADARKFLHDMNGSLSVIKGFFKSLEQSSLTNIQREYCDAAMRSVEKMERAIRETRANKTLQLE